jgi:hypothetical protein
LEVDLSFALQHTSGFNVSKLTIKAR